MRDFYRRGDGSISTYDPDESYPLFCGCGAALRDELGEQIMGDRPSDDKHWAGVCDKCATLAPVKDAS